MMTTLAVENYRSLRQLVVPLGPLNVVTGANGSGKSSLYRALRLLADAARGGAVAALAREGGLGSTLWAGPEKPGGRQVARVEPVSLRLGFSGGRDDFGYALDLGLPSPTEPTMFGSDPDIKRESVWSGPVLRPAALLAERHNGAVRIRDTDGTWSHQRHPIRPYDSMLSEFADPRNAPEVLRLRDRIRSWRFYDHFRTDAAAPARGSHVGTRTPVLSHDGADLAAAVQTIREIGDREALEAAVDLAFPGSRLTVADHAGRFDLELRQPGLLRPLRAAELSDGTLRYLLLVAALLTPRPPELLVLNEPETSLHPDLLSPLAQLIAMAAARSQIIVVSHSRPLTHAVERLAAEHAPEVRTVELTKEHGQTRIVGQGLLDEPAWHWPKR
ncbi:AAA family ATPase [Streptantibioticus rubrisoli]|uniref:AAA family ATPase n=1 Tax=Streptantibioticus rubrisoli TaxID=1387313 RepID=A0ABT1P7I8_9ACTN|nr:AAA family ATPase [Streptantibioticus rubrisoli]MCQ4041346.1 AAA family ATPase [Streptantibioticus rubrisoli]